VAKKYDHQDLERQFVHGTMSMRQLCRDNGISTWSTVSVYAKRNGWLEKREEFQQKLREAESRVVVENRAAKLASALDDAIMVANQAVYTFLDSLKDRWVSLPGASEPVLIPAQQIAAGDFVKILEKIMLLNGQVSSREAHLSMEVSADQLTMEMLRDLADAARQAGADTRPVISSPLPRLEGEGFTEPNIDI